MRHSDIFWKIIGQIVVVLGTIGMTYLIVTHYKGFDRGVAYGGIVTLLGWGCTIYWTITGFNKFLDRNYEQEFD